MGRHNISIVKYVIITFLTCGIFNLYWNYRQMEACNDMLKRDEFNFWLILLLTLVTCGIYFIIYQYKMSMAVNEIKEDKGMNVDANLPLISILLVVFGFGLVTDIMHQIEINAIAQNS